MDLQSLTKQLIYDEHNIETPDIRSSALSVLNIHPVI